MRLVRALGVTHLANSRPGPIPGLVFGFSVPPLGGALVCRSARQKLTRVLSEQKAEARSILLVGRARTTILEP